MLERDTNITGNKLFTLLSYSNRKRWHPPGILQNVNYVTDCYSETC